MDKALNFLSLARKAGCAELGEEPAGAAARAGKAYVLFEHDNYQYIRCAEVEI